MDINYVILPSQIDMNSDPGALKKAAVIVHLFYEDKLERSFSYIRNIPENMDAYIITANKTLEERAKILVGQENLKNVRILAKPNRGRDYAALFVTSRDILPLYEYVCFVHDKKSHRGDVKELGELWEKCLFECTLASKQYIRNIIWKFEQDKELGFLSAPVSPEEYLLGVDGELWTINYEQTTEFLRTLGLKQVPNRDDNPLYVGSAFWFRCKAIQKLLDLNIGYDDFPEEPMSIDGTFAHTLERSFGFVAEDAGFKSAYAAPIEYAEYILSKKTEQLTKSLSILRNNQMIAFTGNKVDFDISDSMCRQPNEFPDLIDYCLRYQRIFLFTEDHMAARNGECMEALQKAGIVVGGTFSGTITDDAIIKKPNNGFVICAGPQKREEYVAMLSSYGRKAFVL